MEEFVVKIHFSHAAAARLEAAAGLVMSHDYAHADEREEILQAMCREFPEIDLVVKKFRGMKA